MSLKRPLLFEHLPKTSGSTFHGILSKQYSKIFHVDYSNPQKSPEVFISLSKSDRQKFQAIKGHGALKLANYIDSPILLTFLRDPVKRFLSSYRYIKSYKGNKHHKSVNGLNGLSEFIDYARDNNMDNVQTRHLALTLDNWGTDGYHHVNLMADNRKYFKKAEQMLYRMDYVFLTHHFDYAIIILYKNLGWNKYPFYIRKNTTKRKDGTIRIEPQVLERIKKLEQFDLELYKKAEVLSQALLNQYDIKSEVRLFRNINSIYQYTKRMQQLAYNSPTALMKYVNPILKK